MEKTLLKKRLTNKQLLNLVAKSYEISPESILSRDRTQEVCDARFIYYRLLKDKGYTLNSIGKLTGHRTHTAVKNGLQKIDDVKELNDVYVLLSQRS